MSYVLLTVNIGGEQRGHLEAGRNSQYIQVSSKVHNSFLICVPVKTVELHEIKSVELIKLFKFVKLK